MNGSPQPFSNRSLRMLSIKTSRNWKASLMCGLMSSLMATWANHLTSKRTRKRSRLRMTERSIVTCSTWKKTFSATNNTKLPNLKLIRKSKTLKWTFIGRSRFLGKKIKSRAVLKTANFKHGSSSSSQELWGNAKKSLNIRTRWPLHQCMKMWKNYFYRNSLTIATKLHILLNKRNR